MAGAFTRLGFSPAFYIDAAAGATATLTGVEAVASAGVLVASGGQPQLAGAARTRRTRIRRSVFSPPPSVSAVAVISLPAARAVSGRPVVHASGRAMASGVGTACGCGAASASAGAAVGLLNAAVSVRAGTLFAKGTRPISDDDLLTFLMVA